MTRTEKRRYEERIRELEDKLAYEMGLNEAIKKATENGMLPLKGVECTGCKHCLVYVAKGRAFAIACRKDVSCTDFEKSEWTVQNYTQQRYGYGSFRIDAENILVSDESYAR